MAKQELPFRGHDDKDGSLNRGNYREPLECLPKYDSMFERHLHGRLADREGGNSGVFTSVSADIQNELIECKDSVTQAVIDEEIGECSFFSIQVDETTDVSIKEQLSVIIRLDKKVKFLRGF